MIVSRYKANEALVELAMMGVSPDDVTHEQVKAAYRKRAAETHPDMPGGSLENFAAVDRAKHILEAWLAKPDADAPKGLHPTACGNCAGTGRIKVQRGFTSMTVVCQPCGGTGDADLDKEKQNDGR